METPAYPTITDEEGKVFYIVPELLSLVGPEHAAHVQAAADACWQRKNYPAGCSACHFNKKERRQEKHPSRDRHEHCNSPVNGVIHNSACADNAVVYVSPRNLKRYQIRAVVARLTGELK